MLDCCSSRQHIDQRNLENPEITHQLRFMNEAESEIDLPNFQIEKVFTLVRQYSLNGIITFSQLSKGVVADMLGTQITSLQQDKLASFMKLPFFEAKSKAFNFTPDISLSNKPLDAFNVMLFLLLYIQLDSSSTLKNQKQRLTMLINIIYGEELDVMERHSPQFVRLLQKLFYIPTLLCTQAVMCELGYEQEITGHRSFFRPDDKINRGVLLKGDITPDDVQDVQRLYRMVTRNNILKDFVLFVLKQHFSASRALISRKSFSQRIVDFDYFMVRPRQIRYEFLQYIDSHKERVIEHIPRHPLIQHRGSAPESKKKKKNMKMKSPNIQAKNREDRLSPEPSIRSTSTRPNRSKKKQGQKKEFLSAKGMPQLLPYPERVKGGDRQEEIQVKRQYYQEQEKKMGVPQFKLEGPRTQYKPPGIKKKQSEGFELDYFLGDQNQPSLSQGITKPPASGSMLKRAIGGQEKRPSDSLSSVQRDDTRVIKIIRPGERIQPSISEQRGGKQERSGEVLGVTLKPEEVDELQNQSEKDTPGEPITLQFSPEPEALPKPKQGSELLQMDKKKRQILIKEHLSQKFSKTLIKFFLKFQKQRTPQEYERNSKRVIEATSIDQLITYSPGLLEKKDASTLYRLKKGIKELLTVQDLQALAGANPLSPAVYDYYTQILTEFGTIDSERYFYSCKLGDTQVSEPLQITFFPYRFGRECSEDEESCLIKYQDLIKSVLLSDFVIVPIEPDALVVLDVQLNQATCYSFNPQGANQMAISNIILYLLSHSSAMLKKQDPSDQLNGNFQNVGMMEGESELMLMSYIAEKMTMKKPLDLNSYNETIQRSRMLDNLLLLARAT